MRPKKIPFDPYLILDTKHIQILMIKLFFPDLQVHQLQQDHDPAVQDPGKLC